MSGLATRWCSPGTGSTVRELIAVLDAAVITAPARVERAPGFPLDARTDLEVIPGRRISQYDIIRIAEALRWVRLPEAR